MWSRAQWARRPAVADALLAGAAAIAALTESTQPGRGYSAPALMVPAALLVTLPLALRRRAPLPVLLVATAAATGLALVSRTPASAVQFVALLVALYTVAVQSGRRAVLAAVAVAAVGATITALKDPATHSVLEAVPTFVVIAAVVGLAQVVRRSRAQAASLRRLAAELAAGRAEAEAAAVISERLRIARDMHDVLAHSVSVMVLQAGAARISLHEEGRQARQLLRQVEDVGREALADLREVLGLLRDPNEHTRPELTSAAADLETVVDAVRAAGLPVVVRGAEHLSLLTPSVRLTVFRVVQEALTNVVKHAGRSATEVDIEVSADVVVVQVTDVGTRDPAGVLPGSGHGLIGLRERVGAHGGVVDAGPSPQGGWRVRAVLRRDPDPAIPPLPAAANA